MRPRDAKKDNRTDFKKKLSRVLRADKTFSKVTGYKISTRRLAAFLDTNNSFLKHSQEDDPIDKATAKYKEINLTKEMKYQNNGNHKTLIKELEIDKRREVGREEIATFMDWKD